MSRNQQTREQLLGEIKALSNRIAELERASAAKAAAPERSAAVHGPSFADFSDVFEAIGDPVSIQDTDFTVLYQNRAHRELVGTHLGERCYEAYNCRTSVCDHCPIALAFSDGGIHTVEKPGAADKGILRVEITASVLRDSNGKITAGIEVVRDISERVRAEKALRSAETQFRDLVEQSLIGICIYQDDRFTYVNPLTAELFGYTQQEMLSGMRATDLVAEEQRRTVEENIRSLYDGRIRTLRKVLPAVRKDGSIIEVETQCSLTDYLGKPALICMLLDVTDRKKLEFAAEQSRRLSSVSSFAGGIANEFNNILTAIIGNLAIAKMYAKPGYEVYDVLAEAEKASLRARDLTAQLLNFAHRGDEVFVKKRLAVAPLLHGLESLTQTGTQGASEFAIPENLWVVEGDAPMLAEAFSSLFQFVRKLTIDGGILSLRSENVTIGSLAGLPIASGPYVLIALEAQNPDAGPKEPPHVFDPLQKRFSSIGLADACAIITNHGGQVTSEVIPGRGTIFRIYLPASGGSGQAAVSSEPSAVYGQGRVLVMDDEEIIRLVISRLLLQCGYESDLVSNGEEMLDAYKRQKAAGTPYTAVILDLMIQTGMDGQSAIGHLLNLDPDARAIVSSGYSNDPAITDYRKFGFRGFLAKPYNLEDLRRVLHEITSTKQ
ncbi:MAG: hypothetical protein OHK006_18160 [Thermodesulfovibrionales bacterium]